MTLFFWVTKRINVTQAALPFYLLPVFGVLISIVTLKEKWPGRNYEGRPNVEARRKGLGGGSRKTQHHQPRLDGFMVRPYLGAGQHVVLE